MPGEPSLYLTGDVRGVLTHERPDVCVPPCGSAQLDYGGPILMPLREILAFWALALA